MQYLLEHARDQWFSKRSISTPWGREGLDSEHPVFWIATKNIVLIGMFFADL